MADNLKYLEREILNKVLNSGEDAIKVDIDNVTLKTEGSDVAIEVHLDKAEDSALMFSHTVKTGTGGTSYVPLVDSDGHLQVDALSTALPSGAATEAKQDVIETTLTAIETDAAAIEVLLTAANVDHAANEVLLTNIDADTNAIKIDMAAIEVLLTAANVDHAANEVLLTGIDADTDAIKTDMAAIEVLLTAANVDHAANEALLTTIDSDTNNIKTATEASQSALEKMLYGTALAVTAVDGGSDHSLGATYEAFFIGVGGDISLDCATSGNNIVFKNVASGQLLPVRATVGNESGTTATNIVALKA